ncbi:hypothetical protein MKZ38_005487 [Zalerion maritima]|uniref:non-specific serine/threonine protein kinase n=1 Tax=Zalerion maritima TaxID=339359 RepID=A0AAD5WU74_9PEZI|nr:hypothetical protein MKZ38_005487 [Zalerion maritima]
MGQNYSLTTLSSASANIDIPELSDAQSERYIGSARFMKTIRARHHDGLLLIKIHVKPYAEVELDKYRERIIAESKTLADIPNALPVQQVIATDTSGYLVRQCIFHSLYDRMSTRPFLHDIEKKWLAFQLLCAVRDCHAQDVYHGDIKTENMLVTSWNWLYLSDFSAPFKPVNIPDDNPADFSYFFDTSGRRTCYIAPERFLTPGESASPKLTVDWAMDIFSVGCVVAELFLETPIFNLHQMLKYRKGEYDPTISHLSRIPDKDVREMISTMIQLDPEKRYSADEYLKFFKGKVFPEYFYSFLHQYMALITDPFSGQRMSNASKNHGEADERIDRVFLDFDKISYFLGYPAPKPLPIRPARAPRLGLRPVPVRLDIPNYTHEIPDVIDGDKDEKAVAPPTSDDGTLIFVNLILASVRNSARAASKIRACDILLAFSEKLTDEAKLDRVLPYLVCLLNDKVDTVVVAAIRTITQLLKLVEVISLINANVFTEYLFHRFNTVLPTNGLPPPSSLVRATYASCLGSLATSATKFLDTASALSADGSLSIPDPEVEPGTETKAPFAWSFDVARLGVVNKFETHTKALIEDSDPFVRRAFLGSVSDLCVFFGEHGSNDIIFTHLNTYLNDRDWTLKCAFIESIGSLGIHAGASGFEEFILPLMAQALTDQEEHVVQAVLHTLATMVELGLMSEGTLLDMLGLAARFTAHPNMWIRESAAELLAASGKFASPAVKIVRLLPRIQDYTKPHIMPKWTVLDFLDILRKPLPRTVFDQALLWAQTAEKGLFWRPLQKLRRASFGAPAAEMQALADLNAHSMSKIARNEEDEQWLARLRKLGMTAEDEFKLLAMREYIWRLSQVKSREPANSDAASAGKPQHGVGQKISLLEQNAKITTVMFDETQVGEALKVVSDNVTGSKNLTLEDALQEATATSEVVEGARRRLSQAPSRAGSLMPLDRRTSSAQHGPGLARSPTSTPDGQPEGSQSAARRRPPHMGGAAEDDRYVQPGRSIRHQSSAISLLNRNETMKSGAETGTTQANVLGELKAPYPGARPRSPMREIPEAAQAAHTKTIHTYNGNDPTVKKMLDNMYVDNFPYDMIEFGPPVTPVHRIKSKTGPANKEIWKPTGALVATFAEHKGAINRIIPSPDHMFFLTASDDGSVKVWDTSRLEKNPAYRSRQTHRHAVGAKVVALCFIENTHTFVSCADDGSVNVVKVDCAHDSRMTRYSRTRLLREYQLPNEEYAVWCEHYRPDSGKSVLILATASSRVLAIDLRDMSLMYVLENPVHHGAPTCFCLDKRRYWLLLGTSHGVLDLWDLRFKVRLKGWGVPGKTSIFRLSVHPTKGKGKWVCCSGGTGQGEVTVWDLEKTTVREVYRVASPAPSVTGTTPGSPAPSPGSSKAYEPWEVDDDKPGGMLGRFATSIEPSTNSNPDKGVRGMVVGSSQDDARDVRNAFIVTGGSDKKLRFWDLGQVEKSLVFSGLGPDEGRMAYTHTSLATTMTLNHERASKVEASNSSDTRRNGGGQTGGRQQQQHRKGKSSRSSVISVHQQNLLKSHLDAILDVAVVELPYQMVVSGDRSGVVFVFS